MGWWPGTRCSLAGCLCTTWLPYDRAWAAPRHVRGCVGIGAGPPAGCLGAHTWAANTQPQVPGVPRCLGRGGHAAVQPTGPGSPLLWGSSPESPSPPTPTPRPTHGKAQVRGPLHPLGHLSFAQGPLSFEFLGTALDPRAPKPPLVSCSLRTPWFPPSLVFPSSCSPSSKPLFNAPCSPRAQLTQEQGEDACV